MGLNAVLVDTSLVARPGPSLGSSGFRFAVSVLTLGELNAGILLAPDQVERASRLQRLTEITDAVRVLEVDAAVAAMYGRLRAVSGRRPSNDLWIAATALAHDLELLTADEQQSRLPLVRTRLVR